MDLYLLQDGRMAATPLPHRLTHMLYETMHELTDWQPERESNLLLLLLLLPIEQLMLSFLVVHSPQADSNIARN